MKVIEMYYVFDADTAGRVPSVRGRFISRIDALAFAAKPDANGMCWTALVMSVTEVTEQVGS